jgi:membrane associated rhomboid family serine protease
VLFVVALVIVAGIGLATSTEEQRAQLFRTLRIASRIPLGIARHNRGECAPYFDALRERMRFPLATLAIVALNVVFFVLMIFGRGSIADPETLVAWGANFGPRTTNGGWWRLISAMFVHAGFLAFVVNVAALAQVGLVLERVVGRLAFAAVFLLSGILASLVCVSAYPVIVSAGASGAVAGIYGLLIACAVWDFFRPTETPIPVPVGQRLAPAAALFLLYNLFDGGIALKGEIVGFLAGLVSGLVLTSPKSSREPGQRMVGAVAGAMAAVALVTAVSLRGIADVRPEIARVLDIEGHTVPGYRAAEALAWKGQIDATTLASLIESKIMPELRAASERLVALRGVPLEHQQLIADAKEYLRLRYDSWKLRAQGLRRTATPLRRDRNDAGMAADARWRDRAATEHRATQVMLGRAEGTERASLEMLAKLKPPTVAEAQ